MLNMVPPRNSDLRAAGSPLQLSSLRLRLWCGFSGHVFKKKSARVLRFKKKCVLCMRYDLRDPLTTTSSSLFGAAIPPPSSFSE